jgi:DUF4097 and DUF4098 domain-containing protein YvlB
MKNAPSTLISAAILIVAANYVGAQTPQQTTPDRACTADHNGDDNRYAYAESRDQRLSVSSMNYINPGANGSIRVEGWNHDDVLVRACIQTAAPTESEARALASQIVIAKGAGTIEPEGPSVSEQQHWNVSYEVWVPMSSNLKLEAHNGSLSVRNVHGEIRFTTVNGSVHLSEIGGDVDGTTTNGSLAIDLSGSAWNGRGLNAQTTNGSIHLNMPDNYGAQIEVATVNGKVRSDFPITMGGDVGNATRNVSITLGSGGPPVEVKTTNGSVHIGRRAA